MQEHSHFCNDLYRKAFENGDLALDNFKNFVKTVFDKEGNYRHDIEYPAVMGNNCFNCNYCEFNDRHDICPTENRL